MSSEPVPDGHEPAWIEVEGAANMRDVAGLPTADGHLVRAGRLIRSDTLQGLTDADVRHLVDDLRVRAVADLRTGTEVRSEGPGPITREDAVDVVHLSLFPESGDVGDVTADTTGDEPVVLPWQQRDQEAREAGEQRRGVSGVYLRYLADRADSVIAALRLIAGTDGATIVHCAAGKDRTGVVIAFALAEIGVTRAAIIDDYAASADRIERIVTGLAARRTYAGDIDTVDIDRHKPKAVTMERLLDSMDELYGGVPAWLRANGWTEHDAAMLRQHLVE